jgi:hypothetical protein
MKNYNQDIQLMIEVPEIQNEIIKLFKENKIPVHKDTNKFDPVYPYLLWDGYMLTQTYEDKPLFHGRIAHDTVEEFLFYFNLSLSPKRIIYAIY